MSEQIGSEKETADTRATENDFANMRTSAIKTGP
jgi:hypothetical protein